MKALLYQGRGKKALENRPMLEIAAPTSAAILSAGVSGML